MDLTHPIRLLARTDADVTTVLHSFFYLSMNPQSKDIEVLSRHPMIRKNVDTAEDGLKGILYDLNPDLYCDREISVTHVLTNHDGRLYVFARCYQYKMVALVCYLPLMSFCRTLLEQLDQEKSEDRLPIIYTLCEFPVLPIANFVYKFQFPSKQLVSIQFSQLDYIEDNDMDMIILSLLTPVMMIKAWEALITERRILVISQHAALLLPCCEFLRKLIAPMTFVGTFIPQLPSSGIEAVEAPGNFIIGAETKVLKAADVNLCGCVILDLDHGCIIHTPNASDDPYYAAPSCLLHSLLTQLSTLLQAPLTSWWSRPYNTTSQTKELESLALPSKRLTSVLRIFLKTNLAILSAQSCSLKAFFRHGLKPERDNLHTVLGWEGLHDQTAFKMGYSEVHNGGFYVGCMQLWKDTDSSIDTIHHTVPCWVEMDAWILAIYEQADDLPIVLIPLEEFAAVASCSLEPDGHVFELTLKNSAIYRFTCTDVESRQSWLHAIENKLTTNPNSLLANNPAGNNQTNNLNSSTTGVNGMVNASNNLSNHGTNLSDGGNGYALATSVVTASQIRAMHPFVHDFGANSQQVDRVTARDLDSPWLRYEEEGNNTTNTMTSLGSASYDNNPLYAMSGNNSYSAPNSPFQANGLGNSGINSFSLLTSSSSPSPLTPPLALLPRILQQYNHFRYILRKTQLVATFNGLTECPRFETFFTKRNTISLYQFITPKHSYEEEMKCYISTIHRTSDILSQIVGDYEQYLRHHPPNTHTATAATSSTYSQGSDASQSYRLSRDSADELDEDEVAVGKTTSTASYRQQPLSPMYASKIPNYSNNLFQGLQDAYNTTRGEGKQAAEVHAPASLPEEQTNNRSFIRRLFSSKSSTTSNNNSSTPGGPGNPGGLLGGRSAKENASNGSGGNTTGHGVTWRSQSVVAEFEQTTAAKLLELQQEQEEKTYQSILDRLGMLITAYSSCLAEINSLTIEDRYASLHKLHQCAHSLLFSSHGPPGITIDLGPILQAIQAALPPTTPSAPSTSTATVTPASPAAQPQESIHKFDLLVESSLLTHSFSQRFTVSTSTDEDNDEAEGAEGMEGGEVEVEVDGEEGGEAIALARALSARTLSTKSTDPPSIPIAVAVSGGEDSSSSPSPVVATGVSEADLLAKFTLLHHTAKMEILHTLEALVKDPPLVASSSSSGTSHPPATTNSLLGPEGIVLLPVYATLAGYAAQNVEQYSLALEYYADSMTLIDGKRLTYCLLQLFMQSFAAGTTTGTAAVSGAGTPHDKEKALENATKPPLPNHLQHLSQANPNAFTFAEIPFILQAYQKKALFGLQAYRLCLEMVHTELRAQLGGQAVYLDASLALGSFRKFAKSGNLRLHHSQSTRVPMKRPEYDYIESPANNRSDVLNEVYLCTKLTTDMNACEITTQLALKLREVLKSYVHSPAGEKHAKKTSVGYYKIKIAPPLQHDIQHLSAFKKFEIDCCQLQKMDMSNLSTNERLLVFVNAYNMLMAHSMIVKGNPGQNLLERTSFMRTAKYNLGGYVFSLIDIEHGILRNASTKPMLLGPLSFNMSFSERDPRRRFALEVPKPNISFCIFQACSISAPFWILHDPSNVDKEMAIYAKQYFLDTVKFDYQQKTIFLPAILKVYWADFGSKQNDVLKYIVNTAGSQFANKTREYLSVVGENSAKTLFPAIDWTPVFILSDSQ